MVDQTTVDTMSHKFEEAVAFIDKNIELYAPPQAKELLKTVEGMHPLLKQAYVVGGVLLLFAFGIFYLLGGMSLLVSLAAFVYPAIKSLQAVGVTDPAEDKQWLTYWVMYGIFHMLESGIPFIVDKVPYYNGFKLALFVWLYHSSTKGASVVYEKVMVPFVVPHITGKKAVAKKEE
jgi:receptor expression-enhancing protein 5/6